MNPFWRLQDFGQSLWYDHLRRDMLGPEGKLARMIGHDGLRGITTNLADYHNAICYSDDYALSLQTLLADKPDYSSEELLYELIIEDIRDAADQLQQTHQATCGYDGYVSIELPASLAYNSVELFNYATEVSDRIGRANILIKIPSTKEALTTVTALTVAGVNLNISPIFCAERYIEVIQAYINGLRQRLNQGLPIDTINSVASFFIHEVEQLASQSLNDNPVTITADLIDSLKNAIAITNARTAYKTYKLFFSKDVQDIIAAGGRPMKLVWTHSSNLAEVESLIGPETITTLAPDTYQAFRAEGRPRIALDLDLEEACKECDQLKALDINLAEIAQQLENDHVRHNQRVFQSLLDFISTKAHALSSRAA